MVKDLLKSNKQELIEEIESKKWTFIEGNIEMTEKAKKAIINMHNNELENLKQFLL